MNTSTEMFGVIYFLFGTRVNIFVRKCDIGLDSVPFSGQTHVHIQLLHTQTRVYVTTGAHQVKWLNTRLSLASINPLDAVQF